MAASQTPGPRLLAARSVESLVSEWKVRVREAQNGPPKTRQDLEKDGKRLQHWTHWMQQCTEEVPDFEALGEGKLCTSRCRTRVQDPLQPM